MKFSFRRIIQTICLLSMLLLTAGIQARDLPGIGTVAYADLPKEAQLTLSLIKSDGPFPYSKDGSVFGNYEKILPKQRRGYYHEYTVKTPRARNRGARRIISGGDPRTSGEYYYTADHYQTFQRIQQ